jgi:2-octaprenyl-6-methoxyphenol hydroxylase
LSHRHHVRIAVIGAGPVGQAAALALGQLGEPVTLIAPALDPAHAGSDPRTAALLAPSIELLKNLAVWPDCASESAPIAVIRIVDDCNELLRAPEVLFRATELGLADFGANVPNAALVSALDAGLQREAHVTRLPAAVAQVETGERTVHLALADGTSLSADLVIAADGRRSIARAAAGIATRTWEYPQAALVATFAHTRPHDGIVTEFHRRAGPLTVVPLPGQTSSVVWVEAPEAASELLRLDDAGFLTALEARLHGLLGALRRVGPRVTYPLSGMTAEILGRRRIALVGESAHVIPPIGAQGLNLGLRDAATLAEVIADAQAQGRDVGGDDILHTYATARAGDVLSRSISVDLLNRSLLTDFLPAQAVRGIGLHLLANSATLRRSVMTGGLGAAAPLPRLMQPRETP